MKLRHLLDNYCPQNQGENSFVACAHSLCLLIHLCSCEESLLKYKTTSFSFIPTSSTSTVFQGFLALNRIALTSTIFFSLVTNLKGRKKYTSRQTLNQKHDRITLLLKQQKSSYGRISVIPSTYLNLLLNKREIN